jgi:cytochrome P450
MEQLVRRSTARSTSLPHGPAAGVMVIGDHALVAGVLRDRPDGFRRTSGWRSWAWRWACKVGLFGANGDVWKRQRRMVMAGFDPAHVRATSRRCRGRAALAGRWRRRAEGHPIDLQADLMRFTVDAIAGLAFGAEVNTLESDDDVHPAAPGQDLPGCSSGSCAAAYWRWFQAAVDREAEAAAWPR